MSKVFLGLLLFSALLFPSTVSAQVVINEFVADGDPEWVEFYNTGSPMVDLSDYFFDDDDDFESDTGSSKKVSLLGLLEPQKTCYWNLTTYLNNSGDTPTLFKADGTKVDSYSYTSTKRDKSYLRVPDGGDWLVDQVPTKSSSSCLDLAPSPTPTPIPTPSPGPSSTNTPTPTSEPTATPTNSPTLKPTVKSETTKTPTPTIEGGEEDGEDGVLLGLRDELSPTPTPESESEKGGKFPLLAGLFMTAGLGFIGAAGYPFFKDWKKRYNIKDGERKEKPEVNA